MTWGHGQTVTSGLSSSMVPRCLSFLLLVQIAAIRNDDDEGQLSPQLGWDPITDPSAVLETVANHSGPFCGHTTHMDLEGHMLHCDTQLAKIRRAFEVPDPDDILKDGQINLETAEEGTGKSGARMIFSDDKKYIIKTMTSRDLKAMANVIDAYVSHVVGHASTSELMRIYAIVEDPQGGFWSIGNNWLPVHFPITWDLKGSTVGRASGKESRSQKDKDWTSQNKALALPPGQRTAVLQALESDSMLLARSNLIDYSLIAGVLVYQLEPCDGENQPSCVAPICHPEGGCGEAAYSLGRYFPEIKDFYCHDASHVKERQLGHSCGGGFTKDLKVYFQCFGVIDLWKPYDFKSRVEYGAKAGFVRKVSAQPADAYAKRFFEFMYQQVFPKDLAESTAPLIFTPSTCGAWGGQLKSAKGGSNRVIIGLSISVALILGVLLAWYFLRQKSGAADVGGQALEAYQPDVSQSWHGPPGYAPSGAYGGPTGPQSWAGPSPQQR